MLCMLEMCKLQPANGLACSLEQLIFFVYFNDPYEYVSTHYDASWSRP